MVIIRKNWQALPVAVTTVTAPADIQQPTASIQQPTALIQQPTASIQQPTASIQQPNAHLIFEPDIVELNKINHDEPNEPTADTYQNSSCPPPVQPKKKSRIIEQRGLLDQFSFSSSSLMVGGAVLAGLVFIISAGKGTVKTRIGQDSLSGFY